MLLCLPVVVGVGGHLISPSSSVALLLLSINMLNSIASHRTPSTQTTIPICLFVSLCVSFPSIPHSRCLAKVLPHLLPKSDPRFLFSMFVSAHACVFHWWTFLLFTCSCCCCGAGRSRMADCNANSSTSATMGEEVLRFC